MPKKYLTIDDLLLFCQQSNLSNFSAKESGGPIIIQSFGKAEISDSTTVGLTPCTLQACHTELNRNKSFIEENVMQKALASFANRPILGYIHQLEDGTWNFYDHRVVVEEDGEEGRLEYLESPIGVVPESCNARLEYDKDKDKNYVVVNGYLYDDYGNRAVDIIKANKGQVDVSVEIAVNALSYNAKENYLNIEDFTFMGVTCLGKTPDGTVVQPGMEGANLKLDNFSEKQNSMFASQDYAKLIETLDKLNFTLESLNKEKDKGGEGDMDKFEELLAKYGKTAEEIPFEIEGLSDEELEAKFTEEFGSTEEPEGNPSVSENGGDPVDSMEPTEEPKAAEEPAAEPEEKFCKTFTVELSHDDIASALYRLIQQYEEADSAYYYIREVYDDYFYMHNWYDGRLYKQGYSVDGENVALEGERIEVFELIVTESEKLAIEKMREDYSALKVQYNELKAFKDNYDAAQLKAQKDAVLEKAEYECLAEDESFKELKKNADNYSVEELQTKADLCFAAHVKSVGMFSVKKEESEKPHVLSVGFAQKADKERVAYDGLFENKTK